jgi:hypothetical protein
MISLMPVILSAVADEQSESAAKSKDLHALSPANTAARHPSPDVEKTSTEFPEALLPSTPAFGPSTPVIHPQADESPPLRMTLYFTLIPLA